MILFYRLLKPQRGATIVPTALTMILFYRLLKPDNNVSRNMFNIDNNVSRNMFNIDNDSSVSYLK